jgi:uracil-DNA glycosylase
MGFFGSDLATDSRSRRIPIDMLRRNGCLMCPLDRAELHSPKISPSGSDNPLVYILGEAPGELEDKQGKPFVGPSGRLLRSHIPERYQSKVRFSNTTRCWTGPGNPDPTDVQTECCRSLGISDIEQTKPKAIFGFGNHALLWATGQTRITQWRGRRLPVKIGSHVLWFYPMLHPSFVLHTQGDDQRRGDELEQLFSWDMARAFAELERLPEPFVHSVAEAKRNVELVEGSEPGALRIVREFLQMAAKAEHVGMDYETNGRRPYAENAKILSAAVSVRDRVLAFAFDHREARWSRSDRAELSVLWTEFLISPVPKVSHFASFEIEWSAVMFGREIVRASRWEDTASQAAVIDERVGDHKNGPLSLGWLTQQHFGLNIKNISNLDRANLDNEPLEEVLMYNGIDSRYHDYLFVAQNKILKEKRLVNNYEHMLRRIPTVVLTQIKGVPVAQDVTEELADEYSSQLKEIDYEISLDPAVIDFGRTRGEAFNASAPRQVGQLFSAMGINLGDSADEEALKKIEHPLSPLILKHRKLTKRLSTYVHAYSRPGHIWSDSSVTPSDKGYLWPDGLLHSNLNTLFARSGRTSADEVNYQNVIKHDEEGKEVRRQIKARPGYIQVSADQGQIQARNIAMESRDPVFCKMLWEDYDIHMDWAERLSRAYPDAVGGKKNFTDKEVMKKFRYKTKNNFVFALFFNAQLPKLASGMEIPESYLAPEFRQFWKIFSGIKEWHEKLYKEYRETGTVHSTGGFVFHAPLSPNQIVNWPIQNDEALIVLDWMSRLSEKEIWELQPNMEVHDDLIFELPLDSSFHKNIETIVTEGLRCTFDWINVPLSLEVSIGENWLEMHEEAKFRSDLWLNQPIRAKEYF